jgi:hypothetical protein
MRGQRQRDLSSDLAPGVAAALSFLAMAALLGWTWPAFAVSALLSVAVYYGVRLILPQRQTAEEAPALSTAELLGQLQRMGRQLSEVGNQSAGRRVQAICETADALLRYGEAHPDRAADSLFMVRQYLELTRLGVQTALASGSVAGEAARQSRQQLSELLDMVLDRFTSLHERLLAEDDAALAGELKVLTKTLEELDKVYLVQGENKP